MTQDKHQNEPCQDPNCPIHSPQAKTKVLEAVQGLLRRMTKDSLVQKRSDQLAHVLATVIGMQRLEGETDAQALIEALCTLLASSWINYTFDYVRADGIYSASEFENAVSDLIERMAAMLVEQSKQTTAALLMGVAVDRDARKAKAAKEAAKQDAEKN